MREGRLPIFSLPFGISSRGSLERLSCMKGFYPGTDVINQRLIHAAQMDAEWCFTNVPCYLFRDYRSICEYGLTLSKGHIYFPQYTDDPKQFYEGYVDHFAKVLARLLQIPLPNNPRDIWKYEEEKAKDCI